MGAILRKLSKLLILLLLTSFNISTIAGNDQKENNNTTGSPVTTYLNLNNISTVFFNNGYSDINVNDDASGFQFPKGSGKTAVYKSGLIWGTKIPGDPNPRVGGSTYRTGLQPGKILPNGTAEDPDLPKNRIYRVRADVYPGGPIVDLSVEAVDEGRTETEIRNQYELDWTEWPWQDGAPFTDINSNGTYEFVIDIPGVDGADQTIWYVANDLDPTRTQFLYGADPIGVEMQATFWNYNRTGALGNTIFRKYKLINKSSTSFDSMYISMWTDTDLGDQFDDFVGCDTGLNLGYTYNGQDKDLVYDPPPAVGFILLKGPEQNPSIELGMTAFYWFGRGDPSVSSPPMGDPAGSNYYYNFMQGKIGLSGGYFFDPHTGQATTFQVPGDPITGTGWIDGQLLSSGTRQFGLASGSFNMAVGDTQTVVLAELAGIGKDRLFPINILRFYSHQIKAMYEQDILHNKYPHPKSLEVELSDSTDGITINWGINSTLISEIENFNEDGFLFQGYNVYQLYSDMPFFENAVKIAAFDKADGITELIGPVMDTVSGAVLQGVQQSGTDSGIQYSITINHDVIDNYILLKGKEYYYAVTAYTNNSDSSGSVTNTESLIDVISINYNDDLPGIGYGDTLNVLHYSGTSDSYVIPEVVDPTLLTSYSYTVTFGLTGNDDLVWNLIRSDDTTLLSNQTNIIGGDDSPVVDGIKVRVFAEADQFKDFSVVANANGTLNPADGGAFDFAGFPSRPITQNQQVEAGLWGIHTADNGGSDDGGGTRGTYDAFLSRVTRDGANWRDINNNDFELRFTPGGSMAYDAFDTVIDEDYVWVPFELWNIGNNTPDDPSDDYRLVPFMISNSNGDFTGNTSFELESWGLPSSPGGTGGGSEHSVSGEDDDPQTDWFYWYRTPNTSPGEAGYLAVEAEMLAGTYDGHAEYEVMARNVLVNLNGGSAPPFNQNLPEEGTIFRIIAGKAAVAGEDKFAFSADSITVSVEEIVPVDYSLSQNFPNPFNPSTTIKFSLKKRSAVRLNIYNILGQNVRQIINKEMNAGKHQINFTASRLSSGVYFYRIEAGEFVNTKKMILLK